MGTDANTADNTESADATPGRAPRQTDVPTVRPRKDYPFVPDTLTGLSPLAGYAGAVALVPTSATGYRVALYVAAGTRGGVAWLPPRGAVIMDVPEGFSINDGDAILQWMKRSGEDGKPGAPGSVTG